MCVRPTLAGIKAAIFLTVTAVMVNASAMQWDESSSKLPNTGVTSRACVVRRGKRPWGNLPETLFDQAYKTAGRKSALELTEAMCRNATT